MKKLFLSSSFKDVSKSLGDFLGYELDGTSVTFIPTASIPESVKFYVKAGIKALEDLGMKVEILDLTTASSQDIATTLYRNDLVYISGGNTFFLLQELKKKNADKVLYELIHQGKPYIGESAGSIILSPNIEYVRMMDDEKKADSLSSFEALNLIDFYPLPHYTNFPFKKAVERIIDTYENDIELVPMKNSQVILVEDETYSLIDC